MAIWIILAIKGVLVGFYAYVAVSLVRVLLKGAPYIPSYSGDIQVMLDLLGPAEGRRAADLGSGDGRVVMALARTGFLAHGYEIVPLLVWRARWLIKKAGLRNHASIHMSDFWSQDLSSYDVVVVFGLPRLMQAIETKLRRELKPGAIVLTNTFPLPTWQVIAQRDTISLYVQGPVSRGGEQDLSASRVTASDQ